MDFSTIHILWEYLSWPFDFGNSILFAILKELIMPCIGMHATLRVSKKKYVLWCIPHDVAYHYFMQIWKSGVVLSFQVKNIDTLLVLLTTLSWQVAYLTMQLEKNLMLCMKWVELHGDRAGCDDPTMVTYIGCIEGWSYLLIGHQKGRKYKRKHHVKLCNANPSWLCFKNSHS